MNRRQRRKPMGEINVVPYIDVMLVLLVIFMITAPLLTQGVEVKLPTTASEPLPQSNAEPLVVSVDAEGRYYLNMGAEPDSPVAAETLVARTKAVLRRKPGTPVLVRGDRAVDYGKVVYVMALLKSAGAPSVGLMTDPLPQ